MAAATLTAVSTTHPGASNMPLPRIVSPLLVVAALACDQSPVEPPPPVIDDPPPTGTRFVVVSAGAEHTCAIDTASNAYCFGTGADGRLGNGADTAVFAPARVAGGLQFFSISTGFAHSCGAVAGGRMYCWGLAAQGQVGNRSSAAQSRPYHVLESVPAGYEQIEVGAFHSCGVGSDALVYCGGWNLHGQLGNNTTIPEGIPVRVAATVTFTAVSAGASHTCAVSTERLLYCWGDGSWGQLGTGDRSSRAAPTRVQSALAFLSVSTGRDHTCALTMDGEAYCWGAGGAGQLGTGSFADALLPARVAGELRFGEISAGDEHSCAIAQDGRAHCWGHNNYGRLGRFGLAAPDPLPAAVSGELVFARISAGRLHTCAIARNGLLYCWGFGGYGQLGTGTLLSHEPQRVLEPAPPAG